ncbi:hypothetical protein, partial [Pseudochrobactrum lubricantis]|uniref:hypothetical protein n=1 Tax=Pseudochrobactrum lubricantis TaxID=558172 RepID=UPI0035D78192
GFAKAVKLPDSQIVQDASGRLKPSRKTHNPMLEKGLGQWLVHWVRSMSERQSAYTKTEVQSG